MKDDTYWAREMVRIIDQARSIVRRGEKMFFDPDNPVEFGAARMVVLDLDVAADHLSDEFKESLPDINWQALAKTRDKYAHHYADIDRDVVWNLLKRRLPGMADNLRRRLAEPPTTS